MIQDVNTVPDISKSFEIGINFIRNTWKCKNSDAGWSEFALENSPIVPWGGTAEGILSLMLQDGYASLIEDNNKIEKSKEWLKTIRNPDNGWGEFSSLVNKENEINRSWTESTCWVLLSLGKSQSTEEKKFIEQSLKWIINNYNEEGGWGYWKGCPSRIFSTCMALKTLIYFDNYDVHLIEKGIDWLLKNTSGEGGWGRFPKDNKPTAPHSAYALLTLKDARIPNNNPTISKAKEVLLSMGKNGVWGNNTEENTFEYSGNRYRFRTRHFGTPWALQALIELDTYIFSNDILIGIRKILDEQNKVEGYWKFDADTEPSVWSTYDCLNVLKSFHSKAENYSTIIGIKNELVSTNIEINDKLEKISQNIDKMNENIDIKVMVKVKNFTTIIFIFIWSSLFVSVMIFSGYYKKISLYEFIISLILPIFLSIVASYFYDIMNKK